MKKLHWILIAAVLVLLVTGGCLMAIGSDPSGRAVREMRLTISMLPKDDLPDLTRMLTILADLPPEEQQAVLLWSILQEADVEESEKMSRLSAVLAVRLYASEDMSREAAAAVVTQQLTAWPALDAWPPMWQSELPGMLALLDNAQRVEVIKAAQVADSEELLRTLGEILAQLPLSTVTEVAAARFDAGLEGDTLVRRALAPYTQEEIIAALAAETDEVRRNALARAYGLTLSGVDDVLCYLAEARAVGIPAQVCYPGGAVVTWDLSRLGRNGLPSMRLAEGARYLVVRVEEAEEAFEWRDVPLEMSLEDNRTYEGAFGTYYESNNNRWAETVTVTIDTAVMDATPEAFLPSDLSEVDAMVVLETRRVAWGNLRVQYGVRKGRGNGLGKETFRDYRCYGVVQTMDVYTAKGRLVFRLADLETAPDAMSERTDGFSDNYTEANLRRRCHAQPDEEWMQARYADLLTLLQENGGDLSKAVSFK